MKGRSVSFDIYGVELGDIVTTADGEHWTVTAIELDKNRVTGTHRDGRVMRTDPSRLQLISMVGHPGRVFPAGWVAA